MITKTQAKEYAVTRALEELQHLLNARRMGMAIPRHVMQRYDYSSAIMVAITRVRALRAARAVKTMYALALPKDTGFQALEDRLLFNENGSALIFESSTEASVNGMGLAEQSVMIRVAVTPIGGAR